MVLWAELPCFDWSKRKGDLFMVLYNTEMCNRISRQSKVIVNFYWQYLLSIINIFISSHKCFYIRHQILHNATLKLKEFNQILKIIFCLLKLTIEIDSDFTLPNIDQLRLHNFSKCTLKNNKIKIQNSK